MTQREWELEQALRSVLSGLRRVLGGHPPADPKVAEAIEKARKVLG